MLNVLSLGAGVQSTALLLMSLCGEIERLDCAIFADTGWEPKAVYTHLAWLETEAAAAGVPVYRVRRGDLRADALRSHRCAGERPTAFAGHRCRSTSSAKTAARA